MIILVTTEKGKSYARRIQQSLRVFDQHSEIIKYNQLNSINVQPPVSNRILIHCRTASPRALFINQLVELQERGCKVVNPPNILKLTSDKWESWKKFKDFSGMPNTILLKTPDEFISKRSLIEALETPNVYVKPRISRGNGTNIFKVKKSELSQFFQRNPMTYQVLIQEELNIQAIYRVFVIGGRALEVVTRDIPSGERLLSVCLNKQQIAILDPNPRLLDFAERIQQQIDPTLQSINFIDVFKVDEEYVLSEINTACNLTIHETLTKCCISGYIAQHLSNLARRI